MLKLFASIILCQAAGIIGSFFTRASLENWYRTLVRPSFAPPNQVFAPVWITIFVMMGISLYLAARPEASLSENKKAFAIFSAQLFFNVMWSAAFFGMKSTLAGLVVITVLWFLILWNIFAFYKISPAAGILLIPYILWVSFAALLNFEYWRLNG